jgi:hypothetical protein
MLPHARTQNCFSVSGDIWRSTKGHRGKSGRVKIQEKLVMMMAERSKAMILVPPWNKFFAIHSCNNVLRHLVRPKDNFIANNTTIRQVVWIINYRHFLLLYDREKNAPFFSVTVISS